MSEPDLRFPFDGEIDDRPNESTPPAMSAGSAFEPLSASATSEPWSEVWDYLSKH